MSSIDAQVAGLLHEAVDDEPGSVPPTRLVIVRGRRARRRRAAVAMATASLAVLAVGGVVATTVTGPTATSPPTAAAQAPRLTLAAAVAASEGISYAVKVTAGTKEKRLQETTAGAFDPATATGYLNSSTPEGGNVYQERLVNGVRFTGCSGCNDRWKQYPGKHDRLAYDRALSGAVGASADPQQLFAALRESGAKITEAGAGVYRFEVSLKTDSGVVKSDALTGEVVLNADDRISRVTYERTIRAGKRGVTGSTTAVVTVDLSDYGTTVDVDKPADVVVVR